MRTIHVQFHLNPIPSTSYKAAPCLWKTFLFCANFPSVFVLTQFHFFKNFSFLQEPVQEWGEEEEDGAIFGITLRREPAPPGTDSPDLSPAFGCVQYHTVKVRRLKAATLERLVSHLLDAEHREPDFIRVFFSMYRAFTSTGAFIELLFQR